MKITVSDYVRRMVPFLKGLPDALRAVPGHPELMYYGTGESAHWSVQCNQQIAGALGILAAMPELNDFHPAMSADRIREIALACFRYGMRTHLTGDLNATDNQKWGKHWISVLGIERAQPGINALRPYFTKEDEERFKAFRILEADYRLKEYPVRASMDAMKGANVPESNIWNAGFLLHTAMDYPDLPQAQAYREKATAMILNGLSSPQDANSTELFGGKPMSQWYVGPNFTENFSLDHHAYMNVGYSYVCLSNLALLYFDYKERGIPVPPEVLHNVKNLWNTVKHFVFPDGRLLRIGGDSRTRYNYCQCFAISAWILMAELFQDPDAVRFECEFLKIMEKEQSENPDGSFYGKRLSDLKDYSYFYYRRLEADPMHALSTGAWWRSKFKILDTAPDVRPPETVYWNDDFHDAELLRTGNTVRSVVRAGERLGSTTQEVLCLPLNRSDMAEWMLNLTGYVGVHYLQEDGPVIRHTLKDGFLYSRASVITERAPCGEGEDPYQVAKRHYAAAALPDGKTMLIAETVEMIKETTFTFGFKSLHCQIPNDVYNDYQRQWFTADGGSIITKNLPGADKLVPTGSVKVNCDNALSFFSICGTPFQLKQSARQNVMLQCGLWGMYADELCMDACLKPVRRNPGDILFSTVCAVSADTSAEEMRSHDCGTVKEEKGLKLITFRGFDGKDYLFAVNFTDADLEYRNVKVAANDSVLFCGGAVCGK